MLFSLNQINEQIYLRRTGAADLKKRRFFVSERSIYVILIV